MSLEQEKEERNRLLEIKSEQATALSQLEITQRQLQEAASSHTDILERIQALKLKLVADEEGAKRIKELQTTILSLHQDITELQKHKVTIETAALQKKGEHDDLINQINAKKKAVIAAEQEAAGHKAIVEGLSKEITSAQSLLIKLTTHTKELHAQDEQLELKHTKLMASMGTKEAQLAQAYADLKVLDARLRREYALILPGVSYTSPLDGIDH